MATPTPPQATGTEGNIRNPGDEAAPGTEQTGELTCPSCQGSGKTAEREMCTNCGGTGTVVVTVGDA